MPNKVYKTLIIQVKKHMEFVIHGWNTSDEEQLEILKKHARMGKNYGTAFASVECSLNEKMFRDSQIVRLNITVSHFS